METNRNYGIDLLRICSMYMIILLHIVGYSGITGSNENNYILCSLIRGFTYCCVDCFALISGYIGICNRFRFGRIVMIWIRTLWFSVTMSIVIAIVLHIDLDMEEWLNAFLPISTIAYWYVTEYFRMFLMIPFLNILAKRVDKKVLILFLSFAFVFVFMFQWKIRYGYHFVWLALLYECGALVRYNKFFETIKKEIFFLIYVASSFLTVVMFQMYERQIIFVDFEQYTAPLVFLAAVCLLVGFSKVKVCDKLKQPIKLISSMAFSVYLFHTQPIFFRYCFMGCLKQFYGAGSVLSLIIIIITSLVVFGMSCIYEYIRLTLMDKIKLLDKTNKIDQCLISEIDRSKFLKKIGLNRYLNN